MKRALTVAVVIALAGCGDEQPTYTEAEVVDLAGLEQSASGLSVGDCDATIVLVGEEEIDLYTDAGDTVITNPEGTVGIKNGDPACESALENALSQVP